MEYSFFMNEENRQSHGGRTCLIASILCIFAATCAFSTTLTDHVGEAVRIETAGRETYQGRLYAVLEDRIELVLADGQIIQILTDEIVETEVIDTQIGNRALYQDAAANRLMVMPTGFPMEKGEFHIADQELAVVTASYGLSENVSLWAGISIPGLVLSGRLSFKLTKTFAVSAGVFAGVLWIDFDALILPYAVASFGTPNRNFTIGGSAVYATIRNRVTGAVAAIGGKFVITPTSALITENWLMWDLTTSNPFPGINVFGLSFRIAGNRLSWDIGAVVPIFTSFFGGTFEVSGIGGDTIIPLPLISLTYRID